MAQPINCFVKELRDAKGWDFATIYCRSFQPFNLPREAKFVVDVENNYITIPTETAIRLNQQGEPDRFGVLMQVMIDAEEIVRVDFIREQNPIMQPRKPGLINPDGSVLSTEEK